MLCYLTYGKLSSFCLWSSILRALLKDVQSLFTVPRNRRTRVESMFWTAPAPQRFFPRKSHRSAFKLRRRRVERFKLLNIFSYLPIENPSVRLWASPRRKLKSHSFWTVKMYSKIYTCQPETVPLIASFWLDIAKQ